MTKIFNYESLGQTLIFAENLGWVEPGGEPGSGEPGQCEWIDSIEESAITFIACEGYTILI